MTGTRVKLMGEPLKEEVQEALGWPHSSIYSPQNVDCQ